MSCERFREALRDRAAGGPAAAGLEAHLEACADCRRELFALREALGLADAELRTIASAEPSPEFRARLRQRVDEARSEVGADHFAWRWPWLASAATIGAAVVVAMLWRDGPVARREASSLATPAPMTTTATEPARAASRETAPSSESSPVVATRSPARARSARLPSPAPPHAAHAAALRLAEPEVLVPAGGQRALVQFVALVHEQKASPAGLLAAGLPSPDLVEPRDIRIEPLEIVPLDPAESSGT
jgi:hypothetical protein